MGKLWVRLDTNIHQHDKILHLLSLKDGHRAAAMYMFSLSWSGLAESDGHIPDVALPMIHGTAKHAQMLCQVGLWERNGRGFVIQNWAERQELAAVSDAKHRRNRPLDASRRVVGRGILTTASAGKTPVPTTNRASHGSSRVNRC